ncbi:MAG: glutaredoxin 3 [Thermoleophilia bacterium]|nr:glutaredoxin 3 [Thermoleophilia bacterium]
MVDVVMYTGRVCPYCTRAKALLSKKGVEFTEEMVDLDPNGRERLVELTGRRTVPQILIGGTPIGGFDELSALDRSGELDAMLGIS